MNRFGAFLVHLGISLVIFAVLAWIVLYVWYPGFFFESDGGWQGIRIIVFVDLVLGPALTLIVFNRKKPRVELKRDLSIIAAIQLICLAAGTFVVFRERPLALVYVDGQFYSHSRDDYPDPQAALDVLRTMPGPFPKRVVVDLPEDPAQQSEIRSRSLQKGPPLRGLLEYYQPMTYESLNVAKEGNKFGAMAERSGAAVDSWLAEHGGEPDDYAFFPFAARYSYLFLGINTESEEIVGLLDVPRFQRKES